MRGQHLLSQLNMAKRSLTQRAAWAVAALLVAATSPVIMSVRAHADTYNVFSNSATPQAIATDDGNGVEVGMKFTSDVDGTVTGVRFYKGDTTNGGTHVGHLWSADGTQLASAQFTSETSSGWQDVTFSAPVSITANTTYVASYYAPQGHYSYTSQGMGTVQSNGPLHTVANSVSPNDVYSYSTAASGAFPSNSYNATNYWVDVDFTPSSSSTDTTAPSVNLTSPADSQTVSGTVALTADASDNVGVASVQFYVGSTALGSAVTGAPYTANWNTTTVANGSYTLSAKATDTSGNTATSTSVNITVQNATNTGSNDHVFASTATPATAVANDTGAIEVGMKFTSDVAGTITGVRFYKGGTTNGGTHYGHLWTANGTQLGQVQFTSETSSGWQDATFSSPINISANTTYIASYYAPRGGYSYTQPGFSSAIDTPPLHGLANTTSPNGVYTYTTTSTGTFPTASWQATNYWVDVDFTPSSGTIDTTAPTVSVTSPTSDQTVSGTVALTADASDNVGVASVQFYLDGSPLGNPVTNAPYSVTWNSATVGDGSHNVTAKATDTSGNATTSSSVTVTSQNGTAGGIKTIWPLSATPAHNDSGDANGVELGVKFTSDVSGYITGVRFYKGNAANGGSHVGQLWTTDGSLLAQATFGNESTSGWQSVAFSTGVPVAAGTTYIASYFAPQGHYSNDSGSDPNSFTTAIDAAPLHALAARTSGGNGVFKYGASASFPSQSSDSSNYWVDAYFSTSNTPPDTTAPILSLTSPTNSQSVSGTVALTADASDNVGVASVQFYLDGSPLGNPVTSAPYSFNWSTSDVANGTHTLSAVATDTNNNVTTTSNTTVTVNNAVAPRPGVRGSGPVLVLTDPTNPFSDDYCSTLFKTEGLTECAATDTGNLTSSFDLSGYRTIIMADGTPLTSSQVSQLTTWVNGGGTFIAMRPNDNLDALLGLGQATGTFLANGYYKVDASQLPGIETQTMQFHGIADLHPLAGAQTMATLYSDASTATSYPAITAHTVGSGKAIAYSFDAAQSALLTRNGNPALAGKTTVSSDGLTRMVDRFGNGWLDTSKASVPQADELQRTLVNLVEQSATLPRLWYFPAYNGSTIKAAIIMTGDEHATNTQTLNRFAAETAASPAGCSVANWTCYTSTSYAFAGAFSDAAAKPYTDKGFEVSPHIADNDGCAANWSTTAQLDGIVSNAINSWQASYPTISAAHPPVTQRFHCYGIWNDYASVPQVEAAHGIKADNNSPCWPNSFLNTGQCLFTGSGLPENYVDTAGKPVNVYQFTTQITDENPATVDKTAMNTLVTNATGSNAYYGYFTALCHLDNLAISNQCATDLLSIAQANNIPMVSAQQAEEFWDGRNNTSVSNVSYGASGMSFTVNAAVANLQEMIPANYNGKTLSGVTIGGNNAPYTTQTINGIQYAVVNLPSGSTDIVVAYQ